MSDRLARARGVLGFAVRRTLSRLRGAERTQILLSVAGVAIAVALLLLVTSVGVGLSASETVRASNADYAIMPSGGSSAEGTSPERRIFSPSQPGSGSGMTESSASE